MSYAQANREKKDKRRILLVVLILGFAVIAAAARAFSVASFAAVCAADGGGERFVGITVNVDGDSYVLRDGIKPIGGVSGQTERLMRRSRDHYFRAERAEGVRPSFTFEGLCDALREIEELYFIPAVDADCEFNAGRAGEKPSFRIKSLSKKGVRLALSERAEEILSRLENGERDVVINLSPRSTDPLLSEEKLSRAFTLRSAFETDISSSTAERKNNVRLSAAAFNGKRVAPDERVSFNATVGARSAERGYLEAKIISGGEYVNGIGGGVCQTSTTLYNALILADVKVVESANHSLAASYCKVGFDAMVNSGSSDLVFVNDSENMLFIKSYADESKVRFEIYGERLPYEIKRRTVVKSQGKPQAEQIVDDGRYANYVRYTDEEFVFLKSRGSTVCESWADKYQDGKLVSGKKLRTSVYRAIRGKKVVGKEKRPI